MYFLVLTSFFVIAFLWKLYYDHKDARFGLPGPPILPLFGNFLQLKDSIKSGHAYLEFLKINRKYGETFRIRLFNIFIVFTSNVKIIEQICNNSRFGKADEYRFYKPWMGDSTLLASGERWSKLRKLVSPAFHFQILESFTSVFEEHADSLVNELRKITGKCVDVVPHFAAYALNVVNESSMGIKASKDIQANSATQTLYTEAVVEMLHIIDKRLLNPLFHYDYIWRLTPAHQRERQLIKIIHTFVDRMIESRRQKLLKKLSVFGIGSTKKRFALLDTLLQSTMDGEPLTNEDIRGEVNTFIFAGHDTTTSLSALLLYRIALHPEVQQKIYDEIKDKILELRLKKITIAVLNNLTYLDLCIKETLRLYLPVPIGRRGNQEIKLDGVRIPANTTIYLMMHANHLNPKYFPDPDKFIPERFHGEMSVNDRHPYSYTPFSAGLRNCVGQRFAILDMKMLTVKLLTAFHVQLGYPNFVPELYCRGLMKTANGMQLKFLPRQP